MKINHIKNIKFKNTGKTKNCVLKKGIPVIKLFFPYFFQFDLKITLEICPKNAEIPIITQ
jgi:hypothetical protein